MHERLIALISRYEFDGPTTVQNTVLKKKRVTGPSNRLQGYANEVGEAFRSIVHKYIVHASYGIASLYVLADTVDKTLKADKKEKQQSHYNKKKVMSIAADTLIWQALASIIIPGFTINRMCALSLYWLGKTSLSTAAAKWSTTAIGLSSIPFIVHPIDKSVDYVMDKTLRPVLDVATKH